MAMSEQSARREEVLQTVDLVCFIDETGHEEFADSQYPVFGFGGCAVMATDYGSLIREPWHELKANYFGSPDAPLHAANLRVTPEQAAALGEFFSLPFARFATVTKVSSENESRMSSYELTAASLGKRFSDMLARYPAQRLVLIFEACQRLDPLADRFFPRLRFRVSDGNREVQLPVLLRRMGKASREAGLEVADFVAHTAGAQVRARLRDGLDSAWRLDFKAVFQNIDPALVSYIEVDRADFEPGGP